MQRICYNNPDEMRTAFAQRLGEQRIIAFGDTLQRVTEWAEEFDPSKLYSEKWWIEKLGCHRLRDRNKRLAEDMNMALVRHQLFDLFNSIVAYSIPTKEAIDAIKFWLHGDTLHEHMAGTGYWAYHLKNAGVKVHAFDRSEPSIHGVSTAKCFTEVQARCIGDAQLPPDAALMLSWVPMGDVSAFPMISRMKRGQRLIYIGDRGCCADRGIHDYLDRHFNEVGHYDPPKLMEVRDCITFYQRA